MQGRLIPDDHNYLQYFPKNYWRDEFSVAESIGFDFVELLYDINQNKHNPLVNINGINEHTIELSKTKLFNYSICADYFTKYPLINQKNNSTKSKLVDLIKKSNKVGASLIIIPLLNENNCSNYDDFDRLLKVIKRIITNFIKSDIKICLEVSLDAKTVLKALSSNQVNVSICYDFGNATAFGFNISEEIICLKDYIAHVHIKDRKKYGGPNVPLGNGDVDFKSGFIALKEINYTGSFTLETAIGTEPLKSAKYHYSYTKNLISTLK